MLLPPTDEALDEFLTRAVARVIDRDDLRAQLASGERRLRIKQGFDPTRPNLHLGHVVCLRKLRRFAEWGHEIVIIVGDWTTQIGDPTDRDESRPTMSHEQVLENAATYLDQFHRVVPREGVRIVHQNEWFGRFTLGDVIRLAARFTAQQMLAREEFRKRLAANAPIPIKDLLYPLLQAYDSVAIESDVEVGGTDQEFNVLVGRQLQGQVGQRPQNVFIVPLLEGLDGEKMSKSKPATAIWLTDTPEQVYGKVMAINDELMPHYFEWATDMPLPEVRATLDALARRDLHPRDAKAALARRITGELHSPAAADDAAAAFALQFREHQAPVQAEVVALEREGSGNIAIIDLLVRAGLASSRSEARRVVGQGGVRVDGRPADASMAVETRGEPLVQVGRRRSRRIRWVDGP